jgi:hypothetical protein
MKMNMKKTLLNLTLAFCAISSHAAPALPLITPISTLPVVITKPGHYYLVANLFFNMPMETSPTTAITVNASGPVVIDMRGFTLQGSTRFHFPDRDFFPTAILIQSSNVTVINGTFEGFWNGVLAGSSTTYPTTYLTGIDLEGLTFSDTDNDGSGFTDINNSIVRNCSYKDNYAGLFDSGSTTGNTYINVKVTRSNNPQWAFTIEPAFGSPVVYSYTAIPSIPSVLK